MWLKLSLLLLFCLKKLMNLWIFPWFFQFLCSMLSFFTSFWFQFSSSWSVSFGSSFREGPSTGNSMNISLDLYICWIWNCWLTAMFSQCFHLIGLFQPISCIVLKSFTLCMCSVVSQYAFMWIYLYFSYLGLIVLPKSEDSHLPSILKNSQLFFLWIVFLFHSL